MEDRKAWRPDWETSLSAPVCAWLEGRGLVAYCEVPTQGCCIDIVATGPSDLLVAVEMKLSLSWQVQRQAILAQNFADEAWCAVPTKPRSLEIAKHHGIGILQVFEADTAVRLEPNRAAFKPFLGSRVAVTRTLERMAPGGVAGRQTPVNDGPAQQVARLVAPLYRRGVPWSQVFDEVPNHYAHAKSLASVMLNYGPARAILDQWRVSP